MALTRAEQLVAYLLAPDAVPRPTGDELPTAQDLRNVVESHKVPLEEIVTAGGLADDPVVASECIREVFEEDRQRHALVREEFVAFRERLDEAGIAHVLIKAVHGVPYRSDNIDLLIPADEIGRVGRILVRMGYLYNRFRPERYKMLYDRVTGSKQSGMLHLHNHVAWYSPFIEPERIFADAWDGAEAGVRTPDLEVSLAIIGAHAFYEDACVRFIDLHKVRCLMKRRPVNWDRLWKLAGSRGFASGLALFLLILDRQQRALIGRPLFEDAQVAEAESHLSRLDGTRGHYRRKVAGRDLPPMYTMSKYFVRRCLFRQVWRTRLLPFRQRVTVTATILSQGVNQVTRWFPQPGMVVAICGPDGCGKTTQVESLASAVFVFEVHTERSWIRIGDSPLLNGLKRPFHRHVKAEVETGASSEQGVFRSKVARTLWPVVAVADYLVRQYARIAWAYLREKVVIADRYHVDAMVDLAMRCGPEVLKKHWIAAAMRLLPKPEPAFVLEISDETMRKRRADDYIEGLTDRVIEYYREATRVLGGHVISGEQDPETITEQMTREFLPRFFRKV